MMIDNNNLNIVVRIRVLHYVYLNCPQLVSFLKNTRQIYFSSQNNVKFIFIVNNLNKPK